MRLLFHGDAAEETYALALRPLTDPPAPADCTDLPLDARTPAESQIARTVAEGLHANDIAERAGRLTLTVNTHITRVHQKVANVNSRPNWRCGCDVCCSAARKLDVPEPC